MSNKSIFKAVLTAVFLAFVMLLGGMLKQNQLYSRECAFHGGSANGFLSCRFKTEKSKETAWEMSRMCENPALAYTILDAEERIWTHHCD